MVDNPKIKPSQLEIYWKHIELPTEFWHTTQVLPTIAPFTCTCEDGGFTKEQQVPYYDWLCNLHLGKNKKRFRCVVTSAPSDLAAMTAVTHAVKEMIKRCNYVVNNVRFIDLDKPINFGDDWDSLTLVVAYNVNTKSAQYRLEKARDIMVSCQNIPFILVAGGTNPLDFCVSHLAIWVDLPIYFRDTLHVKRATSAAKVVVI